MAGAEGRIEVRGVKELQRALKAVDAELPKEMRAEFKRIADIVVGAVQQRMPWKSGSAVQSVKARGTQKGAAIAAGGDKAPYYPWLDFGGSVGRGHVPGQAWSGAIKRQAPTGGRYLYPALAEKRGDVINAVDEALKRVAAGAGFGTEGKL
jgi:hypothetical protein